MYSKWTLFLRFVLYMILKIIFNEQ